MTKKFLYTALAGVSLILSGCSEDLVSESTQATEKHFGKEILFGGSASYNVNGGTKNGTRTVYGGYEEGATEEPVYWIKGDKVRLYCPDAAIKTADYSVTATATDATGMATKTDLDKMGDAGLQWGVPTDPHTFYGVYPIPADNSLKEGTILTGVIPDVQEYKDYTTTDGNVVYNPNMQYAYMVAKTVVNKPNEMPASVYMKFTPIATAVEIELQNDANEKAYDFREVHLSSTNHYLSGTFTANLDNMELGGNSNDNVRYGTGCPTSITYGADAEKQVAVHLYTEEGAAMTLPAKSTLTFTIFMMPSSSADASVDDAINDLKITLITSDGNKTGTLQNISIKKSKKNYMHMMPIGGDMTYNQSEWIKYVENTKTLNELSIPGAGGAASGNVFEANPTLQDYYEQSLSIEELWNVGIRCFEFTIDKHDSDNTKLGEVEVYCNAQETNLTLDECVSEVKRLLGEHPNEFAMVIITYQQQSGWNERLDDGSVTPTRDPATFMTQLNNYWTNLQMPDGTKKALYASGMDVKTARGSLFCIARPTSLGEDNYPTITESTDGQISETTFADIAVPSFDNKDILVIHGWGALKDKWYARGFTSCPYKRGIGNSNFNAAVAAGVGLFNSDNRPGRPFDVSNCKEKLDFTGTLPETTEKGYGPTTSDLGLKPNFYYSTITSSNSTANGAWVQEWARVAEESKTFVLQACSGIVHPAHVLGNNGQYVHWISSLKEKENNIKDCFDFALSKEITVNGVTEKEKDNVIFINSLCGYFINATTDNRNSALPNCLTELNVADKLGAPGSSGGEYYQYQHVTGSNSYAGMCGNIGSFASHINAYFKGLLDSKLQDGRLGGSTGIVLMDRVSTSGDGADIPSIIIANNFSSKYEATDPTTPTSVVTDGDTPLSREGVNIVWGEWE